MKSYVVRVAICLAYYILGAYATTDILRLQKGSTTPVDALDCYCPVCHQKILLRDQLPIISYFRNQGFCRSCKNPIPLSNLLLEVFLFLLPTTLSCILHFNWISYGFYVILYEGTKTVFLLRYGKREEAFSKNLIISLSINLLLFALLAFLFIFANITS